MIAQILSAIGLNSDPLEAQSHEARVAGFAELIEKIRRAAAERSAVADATHRNNLALDKAALEAASAKALATRKRLGREIAEELREAVAPLWAEFTSQPTRAGAFSIAQVVSAADDRTRDSLGCELWDRAIFLAFLSPYISKHPGLVTGASVDLHGQQVALGAAIRKVSQPHANGTDVIAVHKALTDVETYISDLVSHAPSSAPHFSAKAELDIALENASRTDAHSAIEQHRAAADAITMASLPRNSGPVAGLKNVAATNP